jgi:hypothetical protein
MFGKGIGMSAALLAEKVVTGVGGDPVEPGREGRLGPKPIGLAKQGYERLLDGVEGGLPVSHQPERHSEDQVLMTFHEGGERPAISTRHQLDETGVVHLGEPWVST